MDDPELVAIREARLKQLQQNAAPQGAPLPQGFGGAAAAVGHGTSGEVDPEAAAKRAAEEQMRRDQLAMLLDSGARERLARIALVSPQRAVQVENGLIRLVQMGQIRGRVTEQQLIQLLDQADSQSNPGTQKGSIVYQRRKELEDDDFDFDL